MSTSYPTNLDTYTTVLDNVDNVRAYHVNDKGDAITAIQTKLGVNSSAVSGTIDYFLYNIGGTFRNHNHDGTNEVKISVENLDEVTVGTLADKDVLRYNISTTTFENVPLKIIELSDVAVTSAQNEDFLVYNSSSQKFVNSSMAYVPRLNVASAWTARQSFTGGIAIESRSSDPSSPTLGQMWLRTDLV